MAQIPATWNGSDSQGEPLLWSSGLTWGGILLKPTPTRMNQLRVLLGFPSSSAPSVLERAQAVNAPLYTAAEALAQASCGL